MRKKFLLCVASFNGSACTANYDEIANYIDVLIVNQFTTPNGKLSTNNSSIEIYNVNETGLSKSRNAALQRSLGRHIIITDDDVNINIKKLNELVNRAEKLLKEYTFITFNNSHKSGPSFKDRVHNIFSIMRVPSWTILLRSDITELYEIQFDERFGIGARYGSGEENIFLFDLLKSGATGLHLDISPVEHSDVSTGHIWTKELFETKGALFRRTYGGVFGLLILLVFVLKKTMILKLSPLNLVVAVRTYIYFKND